MDELNFPYDITPFTEEESEELLNYLQSSKIVYNHIGPKAYVLPREYNRNEAANIYNFPVRSDDVFVVTFPKSGTTWTQELVWLLLNDLDYEKAKKKLNDRFPFLEASLFSFEDTFSGHVKDGEVQDFGPPTVDDIKALPSPRFIKTHLPLSLLPPNLLEETKVVYVTRDPRDVAVSFYHHYKLMRVMAPDRDFKTYWNFFMNGKITFGPYFASVLEAWEKRNHPNMLFLFYEELSKDLPGVIRRVANFFDRKITEEQIEELREHLKFDNFKKNKSVNYQDMQDKGIFMKDGGFVRKGKVGGWREYFDEEMTVQAEKWINDYVKDTDFKFPE
ncbi:retinol dehydratase [Danaus plexippus plexippus]|uniref:Retinol dehydratase n=1 Tax=Danaus plexippus plexippus TaxID=278856 RepID=A0A212FIG6_DANPL|nr:retinol dehydratase [Danaus plexippus plexippus]